MKNLKKLALLAVCAVSLTAIEAKQPTLGGKGSQQEMISMDELQKMQEMEQLLTMISLKFVPKFVTKFKKFTLSLIPVFRKNPEVVEQKITEQLNNPSVIEPILKEVMQEIGADKEVKAMVKELMPLIKQLFAQDIMKWVLITATAEIQIQ